MGNCCVNRTQLDNVIKANHLRRRSSESRSMLSNYSIKQRSRRSSIYVYNNEDINKNYIFEKELGTGYFGKVSLVIPKNDKNKKYACKSIDKSKLSAQKINNLLREIETLSLVDHPNIVKYYETYNDNKHFHIVMELCTGGDLFSRTTNINNNNNNHHTPKKRSLSIPEKEARHFIYKITSAIVHCHSLCIVHRDLKPENILFENNSQFSDIKVIDFGLSRKHLSEDDLHSVVGSPFYVAPEVLAGNYDEKCDVWSIGILAYCLLVGCPPFFSTNKEEVFKKIKFQVLKFPEEKFKNISENAKNFLKNVLIKNPKKRPTAMEALNNLWFQAELIDEINDKELHYSCLEKINNFHKPFTFTKRVIELLIKNLPNAQTMKFKKIFNALDKKKIGFISVDDLEKVMNDLDLDVNETQIARVGTRRYEKYLKSTIKNNIQTPMINFTNFIAAVIDKNIIDSKQKLRDVFNFLDTNKAGYLTVKSVQKAFERTGKKTTLEDVKKMFEEIGVGANQSINFDIFYQIISQDI